MENCKKLEVQLEDSSKSKWCVPLKDEVFTSFMARGNPTVHKVFGDGSLFSPFLFGKFFDPSDAFPLWEFEPDVLLTNPRTSGQTTVDWFHTDTDYVLKAELPAGIEKNGIQVCVEGNGKVAEISGQWKLQSESKTNDWRSCKWWEYGYVRRLELPENTDWRAMEAYATDDDHIFLEIRIPKKSINSDID